MKLNNKGITLVEIIISVALISIVLVFLFSLLIQVNNENSENEVKSTYLVNQSTFIKQIEEDFLDYNLSNGEVCNSSNIIIDSTNSSAELYLPRILNGSAIFDGTTINIKCLKFTFNDGSNSYVFLYKRDDITTSDTTDYKTILSYYRGNFKQSVELEEFDWSMNLDNNTNDQLSSFTSYNSSTNEFAFSLPIVGPDSNDYSINLSYIP